MPTETETRDRCREIATIILNHRYIWSSEEDLQDSLERVFKVAQIAYEREVELSEKGGRIDFMLEGLIGVEVKVQGSPAEVTRQLVRYCDRPEIGGLILVTGRLRLSKMPQTIRNKPVAVAALWEGVF